jgi:hypothetical protein
LNLSTFGPSELKLLGFLAKSVRFSGNGLFIAYVCSKYLDFFFFFFFRNPFVMCSTDVASNFRIWPPTSCFRPPTSGLVVQLPEMCSIFDLNINYLDFLLNPFVNCLEFPGIVEFDRFAWKILVGFDKTLGLLV